MQNALINIEVVLRCTLVQINGTRPKYTTSITAGSTLMTAFQHAKSVGVLRSLAKITMRRVKRQFTLRERQGSAYV